MLSRFEQILERYPDKIAVSNEFGAMTFSRLNEEADRLVPLLSAVNRPVVMPALPGGPELTLLQLAVWKAGGVLAPIPEKCTEREAKIFSEQIRPDLVAVHSLSEQKEILKGIESEIPILSFRTKEEDCSDRNVLSVCKLEYSKTLHKLSVFIPEGVMLVQFSSGSTGRPKAILLSERNLISNLDANRDHLSQFAGKDAFCSVPQYHAMGSAVLQELLWVGCGVHFSNRFMPGEHLARIRKFGCASISTTPNYMKLLLDIGGLNREGFLPLESFTIGTAALDGKLMRRILEVYPESKIYCRYGLSESVGALTRLELNFGDTYVPGSVGVPVSGVEFSSDLAGQKETEIIVRSGCVAMGQLSDSGECFAITDDLGFLHTGDTGFLDANGNLRILGRKNSFLKVNGYRVSSLEIELILKSIPGVQEAVVVGVADDQSGQSIVACIEPIPGSLLPDSAEFDRLCRSEMSSYKIPKRFVMYENLPRTSAGKPDRERIYLEVNG
ncbi:long-chain fatty acid--CoA ligase [Leptospira fluminis]|uniref:Long-chain fatty acid--CoA ligase n=1 Tax=Leptospira fluminis TaxID=2484979 RepID=A0A4R9GNF0_9LEPT|nr:class I adenylate-forming enzyme family protein [Leptospira fluminis]TGK15679.1 long-chain fatty acid--CoA ligase [Leptospira fluminis]